MLTVILNNLMTLRFNIAWRFKYISDLWLSLLIFEMIFFSKNINKSNKINHSFCIQVACKVLYIKFAEIN